jgi:hypothetical protein
MKELLFDQPLPADDTGPVLEQSHPYGLYSPPVPRLLGAASWKVGGNPLTAVGSFLGLRHPPRIPAKHVPKVGWEVAAGVTAGTLVSALGRLLVLALGPCQSLLPRAARIHLGFGTDLHSSFSSDFQVEGSIPATRTRYGYWLEIRCAARSDSQAAIRSYKDLNYFEMRRLTHPSELDTYGMILHPCGPREAPTSDDHRPFARVCREHRVAPWQVELLYARPFSDGHASYRAYLVRGNRRPRPVDLLIDSRPN